MANARRILKSKKSSHRGIGISLAQLAAAPLKEDQDPAGFGRGFLCLPAPPASKQRRRTCAFEGIWLPLITPFRDGELDEPSLRRLARHYLGQPVDGLILAATTGEGLTLDDDETARLVDIVGGRGRAAHPDLSRRVGKLTPARSPKTLAAYRRVAGRRLPHRLPVLHAALAGGALSAFRRARRRDAAADHRLQHPVPHRREPRATRRCCASRRCPTSSA